MSDEELQGTFRNGERGTRLMNEAVEGTELGEATLTGRVGAPRGRGQAGVQELVQAEVEVRELRSFSSCTVNGVGSGSASGAKDQSLCN